MQDKERVNRQGKKAYDKPEVRRIRLAPEEAVLNGCKNLGITAPTGKHCRTGQNWCVAAGT